jgi:hypothetical protein
MLIWVNAICLHSGNRLILWCKGSVNVHEKGLRAFYLAEAAVGYPPFLIFAVIHTYLIRYKEKLLSDIPGLKKWPTD